MKVLDRDLRVKRRYRWFPWAYEGRYPNTIRIKLWMAFIVVVAIYLMVISVLMGGLDLTTYECNYGEAMIRGENGVFCIDARQAEIVP